jgi:phage FluMu protein Com
MRTISPGVLKHQCRDWVGLRWSCPSCSAWNQIESNDFIPGQDCRDDQDIVVQCPSCKRSSKIDRKGRVL